jgi:hypothetical protein
LARTDAGWLSFARDQRQVLNLWKSDLTAQIRERLDDKYPHQDMSIVVESFDIKLARDISRRETMCRKFPKRRAHKSLGFSQKL